MQTFIAIDPSAENGSSCSAWVIYTIDTEGNITIQETFATRDELTSKYQLIGEKWKNR